MDRELFDRLSRRVAGARTRRDALRLLLGGVAAGVAAGLEGAAAKKDRRAQSMPRGAVRAQQNEPTCPNTCTANCRNKRLQGGANLTKCDYNDRDLDEVNLRGANLTNACFGGSSLRGADLRGTNVSAACFCGADLTGADFRGSNITQQQLACAIVGCTTTLPNGDPAKSCDCPPNCGPGTVCDAGVCQPCTVTCTGEGEACGRELQTHIDAGEPTITICPGRYIGNFRIPGRRAPLTLIGAGNGDNPATSTILDGNQAGKVLEVEDFATATLQGLRLTNGNSSDLAGGIDNSGNLKVTNCTITKNRGHLGGGISTFDPLTLTGCTISENRAEVSGGGLFMDFHVEGPVTLTNCLITKNSAGKGGGLYVDHPIDIFRTQILANTADDRGGGIFNFVQGFIHFDQSSAVAGNTATQGGGIFNDGKVALSQTPVTSNKPNNCAGRNPVAGCTG